MQGYLEAKGWISGPFLKVRGAYDVLLPHLPQGQQSNCLIHPALYSRARRCWSERV